MPSWRKKLLAVLVALVPWLVLLVEIGFVGAVLYGLYLLVGLPWALMAGGLTGVYAIERRAS